MDVVPYVRFVFALFLSGMMFFIGIPLVQYLQQLMVVHTIYSIAIFALWSIFPIIIIFRESIVLMRAVVGERA